MYALLIVVCPFVLFLLAIVCFFFDIRILIPLWYFQTLFSTIDNHKLYKYANISNIDIHKLYKYANIITIDNHKLYKYADISTIDNHKLYKYTDISTIHEA